MEEASTLDGMENFSYTLGELGMLAKDMMETWVKKLKREPDVMVMADELFSGEKFDEHTKAKKKKN